MKLSLNFREIEELKRIYLYDRGITITVNIDSKTREYCKNIIEKDYKFQREFLSEIQRLDKNTLYKKLCEI